jgi:hypothetical protein
MKTDNTSINFSTLLNNVSIHFEVFCPSCGDIWGIRNFYTPSHSVVGKGGKTFVLEHDLSSPIEILSRELLDEVDCSCGHTFYPNEKTIRLVIKGVEVGFVPPNTSRRDIRNQIKTMRFCL